MMEPDTDSITASPLPIGGRPKSYDEINVKAAIDRSQILLFFRFAQDIISRIVVFLLLIGGLISAHHLLMVGIIIVFCAIWFASRERMVDTIDQIDNAFIRRAQGQLGTAETAKWEYFLAAVGARATSRRSISIFESTLRFEPLIWGGVGVIVSSAASIFG